MTLFSTRNPSAKVRFSEAVSKGIAPDGGLFIPEIIPHLPKEALAPGLTFQERSVLVLHTWLHGEFSKKELEALVVEALTFPVPVVSHPDGQDQDIRVMELFHGPTLSFKDFGARTLAAFMKRIPGGPGQTIFVATSGDTGSAVADAFSNAGVFNVALLFPENGVSSLQKLQLTLKRPGVQAFAVKGSFDDCQRLVKQSFADSSIKKLRPGSANSINIGRLLPQMLYYVHAAAEANSEIDIVVPSGNLGNITSALMAKRSGASIGTLVAAHNANHPFEDFLKTGVYTAAPTIPTRSNAMDVGNPSNFERLRSMVSNEAFQVLFEAAHCTDSDTLASMRRSFYAGYTADPHTAVGLEIAGRRKQLNRPVLVASTAHPAKFPGVFVEAGLPVTTHPDLDTLKNREHNAISCEAEFDAFKTAVLEAFSS